MLQKQVETENTKKFSSILSTVLGESDKAD